MWANIARYLKPGGVFVGIIIIHTCRHLTSSRMKLYVWMPMEEYSTSLQWPGTNRANDVELNTEPRLELENWIFERDVVEELAADAGLVDVEYLVPGSEVLHDMEQEAEAECDYFLDFNFNLLGLEKSDRIPTAIKFNRQCEGFK
ncbi:hypothetical protein K438DRAFT_1769717 [Mycena galopus ATCC 62051]|nr:hypothetical protein K438DRAFT_1769717 [Mycena galopus ATCC 62051]